MKKIMITAIAATMAILASTAAMADDGRKVEANGVSFEIPAQLADLVTVETEGLSDGRLVNVYETASVEAAKALGEESDGAGWLFGISRISEDQLKELRRGDMSGMAVFAEDDDMYYVYCHPTDVRMLRESNEAMDADMDQWTELNQWAFENVMEEITGNNPELEPEVFTNTSVDIYLARAAYDPETHFEIRSLQFGDQQPEGPYDDDFIEDLAEDFTFQMLDDDEEAPDGEYIVLAFEEDGVRFDFFLADGKEDFVREVHTLDDGEEFETLFVSSRKDADDGESTTGIMQAWCDAIQNGDYDD